MNHLKFLQAAMNLRHYRPAAYGLKCHYRNLAQKIATPRPETSSNKREVPEENNEPIHYFGSPAAMWRAKDTRGGGADNELWYQPFVISISLAVFLLYFCIFREENDIDLKLERNLYDHVPALEEVQLSLTYKQNKADGLDNRDVIKRLTAMGVDIKELDKRIAEGM